MSDDKTSEKPKFSIPSELRLSQKWDFAMENLLIRSTVGGIAAGLASVVLFRGGGSARKAFTGFGVGFGMGDAYRLSVIEFEKEKK